MHPDLKGTNQKALYKFVQYIKIIFGYVYEQTNENFKKHGLVSVIVSYSIKGKKL